MTELSDKYKEILKDLEANIKDEAQLEYVKEQIYKITDLFMNQIDKILNVNESRIKTMEEKQAEIDRKVQNLTSIVDGIEQDIYIDEQEDEFQIVCPYCNHEFTEEFDETRTEIQCPECNNIIELDWNDEDDGCSGHCSGCHGCGEDEE